MALFLPLGCFPSTLPQQSLWSLSWLHFDSFRNTQHSSDFWGLMGPPLHLSALQRWGIWHTISHLHLEVSKCTWKQITDRLCLRKLIISVVPVVFKWPTLVWIVSEYCNLSHPQWSGDDTTASWAFSPLPLFAVAYQPQQYMNASLNPRLVNFSLVYGLRCYGIVLQKKVCWELVRSTE